ncbi:hypothetical protein Tco_0067883, partial [Tanacetum coccineum]
NGLYDELEHEVKEKEEEKSDYPFGLYDLLKKDKVMQQTSEWEKMKLQKNEIASETALGSKNHEKENIVEKHAETNVKTREIVQAMGYSMEGCLRNIEELITEHGVVNGLQ